MPEYFNTVAGRVYLRPTGRARWDIVTAWNKADTIGRVIGSIELASADGEYIAMPQGRPAQRCASMEAAIKVVGSCRS